MSGRIVLAVLLAVCASSTLRAATLDVRSALGQPLDAVVSTDASATGVSLAPADEYAARGLEYTDVHATLELNLVNRAGTVSITVTSPFAVNEPAFHVLIRGAEGGGITEFGVLLDSGRLAQVAPQTLPTERNRRARRLDIQFAGGPQLGGAVDAGLKPVSPYTSTAATTATVEEGVKGVSSRQEVEQPSTAPEQPLSGQALEQSDLDTYGPVQRGDTLWGIAAALAKRSGGRISALITDIAKTNPRAFINGDINRLKAGVTLKLPGTAAQSVVAQAPARNTSASVAKVADTTSVAKSTLPVARTTPSSQPAVLPAAMAPIALGAVAARLGSGIDGLASTGRRVAVTQTELTAKLSALDAKLRALRARMAAQSEKIKALAAGVTRLSTATGTPLVTPMPVAATPTVVSAAKAAPSTVAVTNDAANVVTSTDSTAVAQGTQAVPVASAAAPAIATSGSVAKPALPAAAAVTPGSIRTTRPTATQQIQNVIGEYGVPVVVALVVLLVVIGLGRYLLTLLKPSRARAGAAARDAELREQVRRKVDPEPENADLQVLTFDEPEEEFVDHAEVDIPQASAPTVAAPPAQPHTSMLPGVLEVLKEADVYIAYSQSDTARQKLEEALIAFPDDPDLLAKLDSLSNDGDSGSEPEGLSFSLEDDFELSPATLGETPDNVIPFAPRGTTSAASPASMYDLGISTDSGDEEDTAGTRN